MEIRSPRRPVWLPLVVALTASGCAGNPLSPSQLEELAALTTITETFSGMVAAGAMVVHPFVGTAGGNVSLTLTAVGPDAAALLGLGVGTWDGADCTVQISTTQAAVGEVYQASLPSPGNYCVAVSDVGTSPPDTTYTVRVAHP
ncbi:MAG TPA: hypothetical protein VMW48_03575 [Vicinamibacterales bacterium]|nr:hypothetical protein [Vicinamibacterales bacterium]